MKKITQSKSSPALSAEERRLRRQRILFGILAAVIIISWIISLVAVI
jgi:predicted nucleic acid-binding Zn ribbon protein